MRDSLTLTDLLRLIAAARPPVAPVDPPSPKPPPDVPFNAWLEQATLDREAWIKANADDDHDCYWCRKTHKVGRLYPEGGCAGPAPPPRPQPVAPEPEPKPPPFRHPPNFTTRARPSGSSTKRKKQQLDHEAEWESFRVYRTTLSGDF